MSHTPGPWVFIPSDGDVIAGDEREVIAHVSCNDDGPLIAAAPGLLNVLREIRRGAETWYVPGDILDRLDFWIGPLD